MDLEYRDLLLAIAQIAVTIAGFSSLAGIFAGRRGDVLIRSIGATGSPNTPNVLQQLAVAAGCRYIVTFDAKDFGSGGPFSLRVVTSREFVQLPRDVISPAPGGHCVR